ncbi:hypothetical protein NT6N_15260 [Oceaniferula spumae]|uniref:Uncharacterized protein n=1 Tax=Oceaniferula spumae TaxID=2979115 RepID=A0AAT9FKH8_9BACT
MRRHKLHKSFDALYRGAGIDVHHWHIARPHFRRQNYRLYSAKCWIWNILLQLMKIALCPYFSSAMNVSRIHVTNVDSHIDPLT